jgi:naphthalene 1,2-dioxygenase system ferredoxin subunit
MTITAPMCQKIWQNLIAEIPLQPSDVTAVKFSTKELAMCTAKYGVCVSIRSCPHGAVDLCDSYFDGTYIERPRHQGLYDVRDGTAKAAPARRPLWLIQTWGSDRFE